MKIRKRIEIEVRTERVLFVGARPALAGACAECSGRAPMLTIDDAARFVRTDSHSIHRLVEAGRVHFQVTPAGSLLICLPSLWARLE